MSYGSDIIKTHRNNEEEITYWIGCLPTLKRNKKKWRCWLIETVRCYKPTMQKSHLMHTPQRCPDSSTSSIQRYQDSIFYLIVTTKTSWNWTLIIFPKLREVQRESTEYVSFYQFKNRGNFIVGAKQTRQFCSFIIPFLGSCIGREGTSSETIQLAKQSDSSSVTFNICV